MTASTPDSYERMLGHLEAGAQAADLADAARLVDEADPIRRTLAHVARERQTPVKIALHSGDKLTVTRILEVGHGGAHLTVKRELSADGHAALEQDMVIRYGAVASVTLARRQTRAGK